MTIEDAYRKLPEYLDGGLSVAERAELERLFREDPELDFARGFSERLEVSLRNRPWMTTSPDFTRNILHLVDLETPLPVSPAVGWWEVARVVLSAAALVLLVLLRGAAVAGWAGRELADAGVWIGSVTGFNLFALHPIIVLGLAAPLLAGGYATCVLTGRCRLTS